MRTLTKEYRNGKGGAWTHRIQWYQESDGINIRLKITTYPKPEREYNMYPANKETAQQAWEEFKRTYPFVRETS
jgi:hypothetical protein